MGLFLTFKHKIDDPDMLPNWHPTPDFGFWKPNFHLDWLPTPLGRTMSIGDFLGVPEEARKEGTKFFVPPWKELHDRASQCLVDALTERFWGEDNDGAPPPEHHCGCPDCLQGQYGDLLRLLMLAQFVLKTGEPYDYGFSWSP